MVDINEEINDNKKLYKYILNIIDHYSKLVGSYLLKHKYANEVLVKINDFIGHYGTPKILQTDHGKEFDNCCRKITPHPPYPPAREYKNTIFWKTKENMFIKYYKKLEGLKTEYKTELKNY